MASSSPRIVIVNFNGAGYIEHAIQSALTQTRRCEVIVVDNASTDGSDLMIDRYEGIIAIHNPENLGFGVAANFGAFASTSNEPEFIAFLNPDAVAVPTWISQMLSRMRSSGVDLASSVVQGLTEPFFAGGAWLPWVGAAITRTRYVQGTTDWLSGCALVTRASAFRALGGFDPAYFLYFEDVDLSLRACALGLHIAVFDEMLVDHGRGGASSDMLGAQRKALISATAKGTLLRHFLRGWQLWCAVAFQMTVAPLYQHVSASEYIAHIRGLCTGLSSGSK